MEEYKYPIITISRQYAALGRTVAKGLEERFGIKFYDRDFVKKTAEKSGFSEEDIRKEGEAMSRASKFMNSLLNNAAPYPSSYDKIFEAEKAVILELAQKQPCIIIGRCANYILREAGIPSFDVYLHADIEDRVQRAEELHENEDMEIRRYIEKVDSLRNTYYKKYTGWNMGDSEHYTMTLDTGTLGAKASVNLIAEAVSAATR